MIPKQTILETIQAAPINSGAKRIILGDIEALADSPVHVVTGCVDCPMRLFNDERATVYCLHPKQTVLVGYEYSDLFATCPLKQNSLTIQLEVK
jgi:hypothetical protein